MEQNVLMKCGHSANAKDKYNKPCCAICIGIFDGATEIDTETDVIDLLRGRMARCTYCLTMKQSKFTLAYFCYTPKKSYDSYYCGCRGWN